MKILDILKSILLSLRPRQWIKNLLIFAALIFSQNLTVLSDVKLTLGGFFAFCIISGSIYIFNDIKDREKDRLHPKKAKRPIASGRLPAPVRGSLFLVFLTLGLLYSFELSMRFGNIVLIYVLMHLLYTLLLKNVAILDIFVVAIGFVLRVIAGAAIIEVPISNWLVVCTMFLSLFLALGKRRFEFIKIGKGHRENLKEYSVPLFDQMIAIAAAASIITYALYTLSPETIMKFRTYNLMYTIPFAVFGIFRYLLLIYRKEAGGSPEETLVTDIPLVLDILLYGLTIWFIIYSR